MGNTMHSKMISGEISCVDYDNYLAKRKGFNDFNEYRNKLHHIRGISLPLSDNKECPNYLGVYIAERYLSKIWDNVTRMPYCNKGFDFICGKGYKIDVKCSCLCSSEYIINCFWNFRIHHNMVADYFLLLAFDNRIDLNPLHIWLIKGDEIINRGMLNHKEMLKIQNNSKLLSKLYIYEKIDKLDKLKECCNREK